MDYETTIEMECALANFFGIRVNLIVPNISWGLALHECDLLIISKAGYITEVEIKVSKADLKKDKEKRHNHKNRYITMKQFYFAVPEKIKPEFCYEHIPKHAGLIIVSKNGRCRIERTATINTQATALTEKQLFQAARLGTMRIWTLKKKIIKLKKDF